MRPFVDDPEVVVLVIASAVRVAETIHALAHFAHELTCLIELQELRCRVAVERTRRRAAGVVQDQDVPLGVDGHGEHFSEVHVGWILEVVRHRVERDARRIHERLLGRDEWRADRPPRRDEDKCRDEREQDDREPFHGNLLLSPWRSCRFYREPRATCHKILPRTVIPHRSQVDLTTRRAGIASNSA